MIKKSCINIVFLMAREAGMFVQGHGYIIYILEKRYFYENLFFSLYDS